MAWLIAIGILVLIAILPVGVRLVYHKEGAFCSLLFGWIKIRLFPKDKKVKEHKKTKKSKKKPSDSKEKTQESGNWRDFVPLVKIGIEFLGKLRRKIRVKYLELDLAMAGDDPCDLALNYGRAWAGVGNVMPLLEQAFVIKKRNIRIQCDFTTDETKVSARLDVTITVGRAVCLAVKYGFKAIREYFKIMKLRKGGADS